MERRPGRSTAYRDPAIRGDRSADALGAPTQDLERARLPRVILEAGALEPLRQHRVAGGIGLHLHGFLMLMHLNSDQAGEAAVRCTW